MNRKKYLNRLTLSLMLLVFALGCVTTKTGLETLGGPMTADLEAKVLRETGLSGAIIGGGVAGGIGYITALWDARKRGMNEKDAQAHALRVAVVTAAIGGFKGWEVGQRKGHEIVSKSMERDYLAKLNAGARAYNQSASQFNATLRKKMNEAKSISDPKEKKAMYRALLGQGSKKAGTLDERIAKREKAISDPYWIATEKTTLKKELADLRRQRDNLKRTNEELKRAYDSTVPL